MNNTNRQARFTSSQVYRLIKEGSGGNIFSAPGLSYIEEKRIEKRMGRCLDTGGYSQAAAWGLFMEMVLFKKLGLEYTISSQDTTLHPDPMFSKIWAGSCDLKVPEQKIAEIKCYQPKRFAQYTDALVKGDIQFLKDKHPEEYWQMVSNACIEQVPKAEGITFMPFESDMKDIRELAQNYEGADAWKYRFIYEKENKELAVLPNEGFYNSLNTFEFEVPKDDMEFLEIRILEASFILDEV